MSKNAELENVPLQASDVLLHLGFGPGLHYPVESIQLSVTKGKGPPSAPIELLRRPAPSKGGKTPGGGPTETAPMIELGEVEHEGEVTFHFCVSVKDPVCQSPPRVTCPPSGTTPVNFSTKAHVSFRRPGD